MMSVNADLDGGGMQSQADVSRSRVHFTQANARAGKLGGL